MSTLQPSEVWILILISSILFISNVVSSDNVLHTPQRIPETSLWFKSIRNNPTSVQDQQNEQNIFCISSDPNIYKIAEETRNQCKGNDYIVTFYYKKDKSYTNLGSFATDDYLFHNVLKKYNNWLLTDDLKDKKTSNDNSKGNSKQYAEYNYLTASPLLDEDTLTESPDFDYQMGYYSTINSPEDSKHKYDYSTEVPEDPSANCKIVDEVNAADRPNDYLKSSYNPSLKGFEVFLPGEAQKQTSSIINVTLDSGVVTDNNLNQIEDLKDFNNGGNFKREVIDVVPNTASAYNLGKETYTEHSMPYAIIDDTIYQNENNQVFDNYIDERNFSPGSKNTRTFNIDLHSSENSPDSSYTDDSLNFLEISPSSADYATYAKPRFKLFYDEKGSKENQLEVTFTEHMLPLLPLKSNPRINAQTLELDNQISYFPTESYSELSTSQKPCNVPSARTTNTQFNIPLSTFVNPNINSYTIQLPQLNSNSERQYFITAQYLPIPDIMPNLDATIESRDTPTTKNIKLLPLYTQTLYRKSPTSMYTKPLLNVLPGRTQSSSKIHPLPVHTVNSANFVASINNMPESRLSSIAANNYKANNLPFMQLLGVDQKKVATQMSYIPEQDTSLLSIVSPTKFTSLRNNFNYLQGTYDVTTNDAMRLDKPIDINVPLYNTVNSSPFTTTSIAESDSESTIPSILPSPAALQKKPQLQSEQTDLLPQFIVPPKSGPCDVSDMPPLYFSSFTSFPEENPSLSYVKPLPIVENTVVQSSKVEFHESNQQFLSIPQIPTSSISKPGFIEMLSPQLPSLSTNPYLNSKYQLIDSSPISPDAKEFSSVLPKGEHFIIQTLPYINLPNQNIANLPSPHKTTFTILSDFSNLFSPYFCNIASNLPKPASIYNGVLASPTKCHTYPLLENPYVNLVSPISFLDPSSSFTCPLLNKCTDQNNASPSKASDLSIAPIITPINAFTDPALISYYNSNTFNVFNFPQTTGKANLLSNLPPCSSILPKLNPFYSETMNVLPQPVTPVEASLDLSPKTQPMKFIGLIPDPTSSEKNLYITYSPSSTQFSTQYSPSLPSDKDKIQHIYTPQIISRKEMQSILEQIKLKSSPIQTPKATSKPYLSTPRMEYGSWVSDKIPFLPPTRSSLEGSMVSESPKFMNPVEYIKPLPRLSTTSFDLRPRKESSLLPDDTNDISWIPNMLPLKRLPTQNYLKFTLNPFTRSSVSPSPFTINPLIDLSSNRIIQSLPTPIISPLQPPEKLKMSLSPYLPSLSPLVDSKSNEVVQYLSTPLISPLQPSENIKSLLIPSKSKLKSLIDLESKEKLQYSPEPIISSLQPPLYISRPLIPNLPANPLIDSNSKKNVEFLSKPIISPLQPSVKIKKTLMQSLSPLTPLMDSKSKNTIQYLSAPIISPLQSAEKIRHLLSSPLSPKTPLIDSKSKEVIQFLSNPLISSLQPSEKFETILPSSLSTVNTFVDSKPKEAMEYFSLSSFQPPEKIRLSLPSSTCPAFPLIDSASKETLQYLPKLIVSPLQPPEKVNSVSSQSLPPSIDSNSKEILQFLRTPLISSLQPPEKIGLSLPSSISPRFPLIDTASKEVFQYLPKPIVSSLQPPEKIGRSLQTPISPKFPLIDSASNEVFQYLPKPGVSSFQPPEKFKSVLSEPMSPLLDSKSKEIIQYLSTPLISSLQPPEKIGLSLPSPMFPKFPLIDSTSNEVLQYLTKPLLSPLQPPEKVNLVSSQSLSPLTNSKSKEIMQYFRTPLISRLQPPEKIALSLPSPISPKFSLIDSASNEVCHYLPKPIVSSLQPPEKVRSILSESMSPLINSKSKEIMQYLPKSLISSLQPPEKLRLSLQAPISPKFPLIDSASNEVIQYLPKPIVSSFQPPEKVILSGSVLPSIDSKSKETPLISSLQPPEKIGLSLPSRMFPKFPLIDSSSNEVLQYLTKPLFSPLQQPEKIQSMLSLSKSTLLDLKPEKNIQNIAKPIVSPLQPPEKITPLPSPLLSPLIDSKSNEVVQYLQTPSISSLQPPEKIRLSLPSPKSPVFPLIDSTSNEVLQYLAKPLVSPLQPPEKIKSLNSLTKSTLLGITPKHILQDLAKPIVSPLQPPEKITPLPSPLLSPLRDSKSNEIVQYLRTPLISSLQPPEKIRLSLPSQVIPKSPIFPLIDSRSNEVLQFLPKPLVSPLQPPEKIPLLLSSSKSTLLSFKPKQLLQNLEKPIVSPLQLPEKITPLPSTLLSPLIDSKSNEIVQYLRSPLISALQPPEKIRLSLPSPKTPIFPLVDSTSNEVLQNLPKPLVSPLQPPEKIRPLLSSSMLPLIDSKSKEIVQYLPTPLISPLQMPEKIPIMPFTGHSLGGKLNTPCSSQLIVSPLQPTEVLNLKSKSPIASKNKESYSRLYSNLKPASSEYSKLSTKSKTPFATPLYMTYFSNLPLKETLKSTIKNLPTKTYPTASFTPLFTPPHSSTTDFLSFSQYYSPFSIKYSNMPTNKFKSLPTSTPLPLFERTLFSNLPLSRISKPLNSQANTVKYTETFSNIKIKPPPISGTEYTPQTIINPYLLPTSLSIRQTPAKIAPKFQNIIEYIDKISPTLRIAKVPVTYYEYAKPCKHSNKAVPLPSPCTVIYSNIQTHNSQISDSLTNSMYNYQPYSNSNIDPARKLKTSVYNYISHEEIKSNLYNAINEVNVPLGNFILAKKQCVNTTTEHINSAIDLKIWPSDNMKLVEARLVFRVKEIQGINYAPVVKNMGQYNANEIEIIATNYIQNKYGNVIQVRNAYSSNNQYEVIKVNNINNKYDLLWPANTCTTPC